MGFYIKHKQKENTYIVEQIKSLNVTPSTQEKASGLRHVASHVVL